MWLLDTSSATTYRFREHQDAVHVVGFSLDGMQVVSASADHPIQMWDAKNGMLFCTLTGHSSIVGSVTFSPDGMHIMSNSTDKTLRLWDART
jgi:WD40 repeat protein